MTELDENSEEFMRETLNGQTAKASWTELERHFARGVMISVDGKLDLVETALQFARDNVEEIKKLTDSNLIIRTTSVEAKDWLNRDPDLWVVVAAPWVLVQERDIDVEKLQ